MAGEPFGERESHLREGLRGAGADDQEQEAVAGDLGQPRVLGEGEARQVLDHARAAPGSTDG